jgi:sulfane dehydrogenase subunit SoxC
MATRRSDAEPLADATPVAGNGLLDRRLFLAGGALVAGALGGPADAEPLTVPDWMKAPGASFEGYGQPSRFEAKVVRVGANPANAPGTGASRTPHQFLNGMITPNGLHFERSHSGIPDIDPDAHRFLVHGLVRRPLVFTMEALARYPMVSRIAFIECAGNSGVLFAKDPAAATVQGIHGLLSCAEWTGVPLALLLDEAGVDPKAEWLLAEGADAAAMSRSVPLAKAREEGLVALYQNGERLRPANGYPMRLVLPGWQGNMNVKWLRRIKLTEGPTQTKDETSRYAVLLQDGRVAQFKFPMDAKAVITRPSPGLGLKGAGLYEISGLAWSGNGRIARVEVSADGGQSWAPAALSEPVLSKALTRFRLPWRWTGGPAVLQSRATDETGYVQPTRAAQIAARGAKGIYHCNLITSWGVAASGEVTHVYA